MNAIDIDIAAIVARVAERRRLTPERMAINEAIASRPDAASTALQALRASAAAAGAAFNPDEENRLVALALADRKEA